MDQAENKSQNTASSGKYDFIIQGIFSCGSIGLGIFLLMQHRFDFWVSKPLGVFCLFFPVLMTVSYIRKQYKFEQERSVFLDKVLGSSPSVIFVYDWKFEKVYVLNGGFPSLGLTAKEISEAKGNLLFNISNEEEFTKIMTSLERTVKEENSGVTQSEWNLRATDRSTRTFRVSLTILSKDEDSTLTIGFAEDVTSHKYVEKYAAMQDLGASISHEINNPLSVISMQAQVLSRRSKASTLESAYLDESIEKIERNVKKIKRTVAALRTLTQDHTQNSMTSFTTNSLMDDIENIWHQRLQTRGIKLQLERSPKDLALTGLRAEITSSLFNLISFCFHHIQTDKPEESFIGVSAEAVAGHIEFVIKDSVPGGDHLHHLFDPTKINALGENVGLSLSFSKSIAQKHSGDLYLDKGSTHTRFIFKIPLQQTQKVAA